MNKKTKLILGGLFIAAGIGLYVYNKNKDKDIVASPCNDGEVPCPNNASVCHNPNAKYKAGFSPCDVVVGGEVTQNQNVDIPTGAEGGLPKNRR